MPPPNDPATLDLPLRTRRSWHWVPVPGVELRTGGGPAPLQLEAIDVLEVLVDGEWTQVPVFEMPKPEHPQVAEQRRRDVELLRSGGLKRLTLNSAKSVG